MSCSQEEYVLRWYLLYCCIEAKIWYSEGEQNKFWKLELNLMTNSSLIDKVQLSGTSGLNT